MSTRANGYVFRANQHFEANEYIWDKWALEACGNWDKWAFGEMSTLGQMGTLGPMSIGASRHWGQMGTWEKRHQEK